MNSIHQNTKKLTVLYRQRKPEIKSETRARLPVSDTKNSHQLSLKILLPKMNNSTWWRFISKLEFMLSVMGAKMGCVYVEMRCLEEGFYVFCVVVLWNLFEFYFFYLLWINNFVWYYIFRNDYKVFVVFFILVYLCGHWYWDKWQLYYAFALNLT